MDVQIPEPAGEAVTFFEINIKNKIFMREELSDLLLGIDKKVEEICKELETKRYSLVDFNFIFIDSSHKKQPLGYLERTFVPVIDGELNKISPFWLQRGLVKEMLYVWTNYDSTPIDIYSHFVAWRDSISRTIQAKNPF